MCSLACITSSTLLTLLLLQAAAFAQVDSTTAQPAGAQAAGTSPAAISPGAAAMPSASTSSQVVPAEHRSVLQPTPSGDTKLDEAAPALAPAAPTNAPASAAPAPAAPAKPDEFPKIKLSGFFHADAAFFNQDETSIDSVGDIQDGVSFRRARLLATGSVAELTNYTLEMDFAQPGRPSFQDVWLEQAQLPLLGTLRIGQYRQPVSMDSLTPVRHLMFMERSLPFQAFDPFRRVGLMSYNSSDDKLTTWQTSVYRTGGFNNAPLGDARIATDIGDRGGYSLASRFTHLLHYDEPAEGRYLLHVGGNFVYARNSANDYLTDTPFYQARTIPEVFVGDPAGGGAVSAGTPFFTDTGRIPSEDFLVYGLSLASQAGSLNFQSEYMITAVNQLGGDTLFFDGAYAQLGYFLTGEHRTYNRTFGTFDKVVPHEKFFSLVDRGVCGWGAWELAARLSYADLNDPSATPLVSVTANPGSIVDTTLGLNWYWNEHAKLQFNWIHSLLNNELHGKSGTNTFAARAALEF